MRPAKLACLTKVGHPSWFRLRIDRPDIDSPSRDLAEDWRTFPSTNKYQLCWLRSGLAGMLHSTNTRLSGVFVRLIILAAFDRRYFGYVCVDALIAGSLLTSTAQTYPDLQPLYDAARSYLEIPQRINLLNTRVEVGYAVSHAYTSSHCCRLGSSRHASAAERDRVQPACRAP